MASPSAAAPAAAAAAAAPPPAAAVVKLLKPDSAGHMARIFAAFAHAGAADAPAVDREAFRALGAALAEAAGSAGPPADTLVAVFAVRASAAAQRFLVAPPLPRPFRRRRS